MSLQTPGYFFRSKNDLPVVIASLYCVELLEFAGQNREIAELVHSLVLLALPGVPFTAVNVLMCKILQGQNRVEPLVGVGILAGVIQVTLMYMFMFRTELGFTGSALAMSATTACSVIALATYLYCSGLYQHEWPGWQFSEAVRLIPKFLRLGVSGMVMFACNTEGYAAGHARTGSSAPSAFPTLTDPESDIAAYDNAPSDERVVSISSRILLVTGPLQVFAAISVVSQGIFRGCGLQTLGAKVNFVSYILLSTPLGFLLAFPLEMGLLGLWLGLNAGFIASGLFSTYWLAFRADWPKLAQEALERTTCRAPNSDDIKT